MMKRRQRSLAMAGLSLLTSGISLNASGEVYPYLYRSAYFIGRGDTGIAIAEDEDAIFYNPAGLAVGKGLFKKFVLANPMIEVSQNTRDLVRQIAIEEKDMTESLRSQLGKSQHLGFNHFTGIVLRRAAFGLFASHSTTAMIYKHPDQGAFEAATARSRTDVGVTFSLANPIFFKESLFLGFTGKVIQRTQAAIDANAADANQISDLQGDNLAMTGLGVGGDLGLMYRRGGRSDFSAGLTLQDITDTKFQPTVATDLSADEIPLKSQLQTVNFGIAISPGTKTSKFRLLADYRDIFDANDQSPYKRLHLGAEINVMNFIGFTAGLNQGYGTFGSYLDFKVARLDLGIYTEEVGEYVGERPDTRFFLRFGVGL